MRKPTIWQKRAATLAAIFPRVKLHPATLAWAGTSKPSEPWLVALSGGADSVTLLLLLWAHWPERRTRLRALHFNHRLRGRASDTDERFCRAVCASLGVSFRVGRWRTPPAGASETEARSARHEFFVRELTRAKGSTLWLGHQLDDVAETMLMRLARGSGAGGLSAPRPLQRMPRGRVHLRPLLTLKKAEISRALRQAGITWCRDATNRSGVFLRNRMRHGVLAAWQSAASDRDALAGAALSRELLEEDDVALDCWVAEISPILRDGSLSLARLARKPRAIVRRALHLWLARNSPRARLSRQAFAKLVDDLMSRRVTRHSLGADGLAEIRRTKLVLVSPRQKISG